MNRTLHKLLGCIVCGAFAVGSGQLNGTVLRTHNAYETIEHRIFLSSGEVLVASAEEGRRGYTLSRLPMLKPGQKEVIEQSLMHKKVTLNHEKNKDNPLFDDGITIFNTLDTSRMTLPLFVGKRSPGIIYLMERFKPCDLAGEVIVEEPKKQPQKAAQTASKNKKKTDVPVAEKPKENTEEPEYCIMLSSGQLKDALSQDVGSIVAIEPITPDILCVAVCPQDALFGAPGSGIALVRFTEEKNPAAQKTAENEKNKKNEPKMVTVLKQVSVDGIEGRDVIRALPLDCMSSVLTLSGEPVVFGSKVSLHWDKRLERLFIGVEVESANALDAKVAGVVVAQIDVETEDVKVDDVPKTIKHHGTGGAKNKKDAEADEKKEEQKKRVYHYKLSYESIVPCLNAGMSCDCIVAKKGACQNVAVTAVKMLWSSTQIPHLIVLREDLNADGQSAIFALPLVNGKAFEKTKEYRKVMADAGKVKDDEAKKLSLDAQAKVVRQEMRTIDSTRGTLANTKQRVEEIFGENYPHTLESRRLTGEATSENDLFTTLSVKAQVGGGALPGYISEVLVHGDSVIAVVYTDSGTKDMYSSRPLLQSDGMIECWTLWRLLSSEEKGGLKRRSSEKKVESYFSGHNSCVVVTEENDGIVTKKRLKEDADSQEPWKVFASQVNEACKGQELFGARELVVKQPNAEQETIACAFSAKQCLVSAVDRQTTTASVAYQFPYDMKSIRGVALSAVDSKVLFLGGYSGLYALVDINGCGWPLDKKMSDLTDAERSSLSFVRVGDFSRIRALVCDGDFLYVLTTKSFERIDLCASSFGRERVITGSTIARCEELPEHGGLDIFLDCVVSEKLALLATTRGLFRIGDDCDARMTGLCSWVRVTVPCQNGPIAQLMPISVTGLATDCARYGGGELYVLNSYIGYDSTRITRFHIGDCSGSENVSASTLLPMPDHFMKDEETSFVRLNQYVTSLAIDGGDFLFVCPGNDTKKSVLYQKEFPAERGSTGGSRFARKALPVELSNGASIVSVGIGAATGKIMVTTTRGLHVLD